MRLTIVLAALLLALPLGNEANAEKIFLATCLTGSGDLYPKDKCDALRVANGWVEVDGLLMPSDEAENEREWYPYPKRWNGADLEHCMGSDGKNYTDIECRKARYDAGIALKKEEEATARKAEQEREAGLKRQAATDAEARQRAQEQAVTDLLALQKQCGPANWQRIQEADLIGMPLKVIRRCVQFQPKLLSQLNRKDGVVSTYGMGITRSDGTVRGIYFNVMQGRVVAWNWAP